MKGSEMNIITEEELDLLLYELAQRHGYDFTHYARASLRRRVNRLLIIDHFSSFAEMRYRVTSDGEYVKRFIEEVTVNVTEMFRDPSLYKLIQKQVLPVLATHPFIRIWHAGCATGEEVYSMAILLEEAGLLHKSLLYATDLNPANVDAVKAGIFPLRHMKQYSENYILSGGKKDFSSYYTAVYDRVKFDARLKSRMTVAMHNLVSDRSFNEFQLIFCRNVLIYFDKPLQDRVLSLFDESLEKLGFLVLGSKENIRFHHMAHQYKQLDMEKIWRKMM